MRSWTGKNYASYTYYTAYSIQNTYLQHIKESHYNLDRPLKFQEFETLKIPRKSIHEGGKSFSALRTGCIYSPGHIPGIHFC